MDPCLENFISRHRGKCMSNHRIIKVLVLIANLSIAVMSTAGEPKEPLPFGVWPTDWECVYAYSETNCRKVIEAWAEDHLEDPEKEVEEVVVCHDCEALKVREWNSSEWITGYRCNNREGYRIVAEDLDVKLKLYRDGRGETGWTVLDWAMFPCLKTWHCHDFCSWQRGTPVCIVVQVVSVGKFQPITGAPCDAESKPAEDSLLVSDGDR